MAMQTWPCGHSPTQVGKVAEFVGPLGLRVGAVWHSTKTRARETAEIIAEAMAVREGLVEMKGLAPNDPVKPIRKDIDRMSEDLAVVGHLPFMGLLAATLVTDNEFFDVVAFDEAALVCLEKGDEGLWTVRWMVTPSMLV